MAKLAHLVVLKILILVIKANSNQNAKINYYEKIISESFENIVNYKIPTDNKEFKTGIESNKILDYGKYDFIIVGAGSAGAVLATRLSEISTFSVLLLEAGGQETDFSEIPLYASYLQFSEMNWGYYTTPQNNSCLGMNENRCTAPRGKALGGSSAINMMLYARGSPEDFNKWAELTGDPSWSYKEVLPFFRKSQNCEIIGDDGYHGNEGFLNIEYSNPSEPTFRNFIRAHKELTNQTAIDYNGAHQIGFSQIQSTIKNGKRHSTNRAFLSNAYKRNNIKILTKALATKVLVENKIATGIEFVRNNQKYRAAANKEVIISAGAMNSPQLLMLSGIGPKEHLKEKNIDVIADLPVGQDLIEHPLFLGLRFTTNQTKPVKKLEQQLKNYFQGSGELTFAGNTEGIGFLPAQNGPSDVPVLEYMYGPYNGSMFLQEKIFNYNENIYENYLKATENLSSISLIFYLILLDEKSRGSVTLKSNKATDFPYVDINMFSDKNNEDIATFIEGIEFIMKLTQTKAYREINATLIEYPICKEHEKFSKTYWECALRSLTSTIYHACGTTRMGKNPANSVVDKNLKVHGIEKLRVVDAGSFPTAVMGHPNAAVIMLAEKISHTIKIDYAQMSHQYCT